jgi:hypothetical protein
MLKYIDEEINKIELPYEEVRYYPRPVPFGGEISVPGRAIESVEEVVVEKIN